MKKIISIVSMLMFLVISCGGSANKKVEEAAKAGESAVSKVGEAVKNADMKTLIIYYSETGATEKVSTSLQELIKGAGIKTVDVLKITPKEAYDAETIKKVVEKQVSDKVYPEILPVDKNISDYDLILVGTPSWFGQAAQPLIGYLHQQDFTGKKVAIYSTYGGNAGDVIKETEAHIKGASFFPGITVKGEDVKADKYIEILQTWTLELLK